MSDNADKRTQEVRIVLKEQSANCSVHLGNVDVTHLVNKITVESKAGCLTKVSLGMTPFACMVTIDGQAVVQAIVPDNPSLGKE